MSARRALAIGFIALAALAGLCGPSAATQDGWPALHDVTGVAADDVLNVRAAPDADAPIIGALPPDARGVEVVAPSPTQNGWGVVNVGGRAGYASLRYLQRRANTFQGYPLPITACYGTEPFWDLALLRGRMVLRDVGADRELTVPMGELHAPLSDRRVQVYDGAEGGARMTLVTRLASQPQLCSDGMSDNLYGIDATLVVETGDGVDVLAGCCTLSGGR